MGRPNKKLADEALIEARRTQVAKLLLQGLSSRAIAEQLNCSHTTVQNDIKVILERWRTEQISDAADLVQIEVARLDRAQEALWDQVKYGNLHATDRLLRIMERRAKLLGLDQPAQAKITLESVDKLLSALPAEAAAEIVQLLEMDEPEAE